MPHEILIIGDPWDTLDHERDSSLHLARIGRKEFGLTTFWCLPHDILRELGVLYALNVQELGDKGLSPSTASNQKRHLSSFSSIHWRTDPPVDLASMRLWSLMASTTPTQEIRLVNHPKALLKWNEKFAPVAFGQYAITGLVADHENAWESFFNEHKQKQLIAKPSGEAASRGVQLLPRNWTEALKALRKMRGEFGPWLIIQEFQNELTTVGETRIFVLGGKIVGAIHKKPKPGYPIMNLDLPPENRPSLELAQPTPEQSRRALEVAQTLQADGVYIATIDFIGDKILEINVTSPGLLNWIDERVPSQERIATKYWSELGY